MQIESIITSETIAMIWWITAYLKVAITYALLTSKNSFIEHCLEQDIVNPSFEDSSL